MEKLEASKKKIIAIIPARGGSKSIKDKNLIKLKKKTLIQRSFIAIKNSKLIDKIVCSTEDIKIQNHCKKIGLDVVKRPKKLAKDNSKVFEYYKPASYSIIKHGVIGLTKYFATFWAKDNIRVNSLSPGGVYDNQNKNFLKKLKKLIPMSRMAEKNEYKSIVQFLCSDGSRYMTGQNIVMDGGRSIW